LPTGTSVMDSVALLKGSWICDHGIAVLPQVGSRNPVRDDRNANSRVLPIG
jgi:hypothetical protein